MKQKHKSIKLTSTERESLVELYLKTRIPIDQFEKRPADLARFVRTWSKITGRADTDCDLIHYMKTQRKRKLWVTFDGDHMKSPSIAGTLNAEETQILVAIYEENVASIGLGSDNLSHDSEIAELIEKEFAHRTRRRVPAMLLTAVLTTLRKKKNLPRVNENDPTAE